MWRLAISAVAAMAMLGAAAHSRPAAGRDGSGPYGSQTIAQVASIFTVVGIVCPKYMRVDKAEADKLLRIAISDGQRHFGTDYFRSVLLQEHRILMQQVQNVGEFEWCSEQKGLLRQQGTRLFP